MLPAVIAVCLAFWAAVALGVGLAIGWPVVMLGCLAAVVVAGAATGTVVFRVIHLQRRS